MEIFFTDLYRLAEFCEYGSFKDAMIRDRLVVGLRNDKLSENLQMNSGLNLEQAVQQAEQSENVRKQQGVIRSHPGQVSVESLTASKSWRPRKKTTSNKLKQPNRVSGDGPTNYLPDKQTTRFERCGHHQKYNRQTCPAKDARCHKCSKQGHFAKCCRAKSRVNVINEVELAETSSSDSEVFLGEISANEHKQWTADIIVNQDCVTFKLDSSADVTVLPASTYDKLSDKPLLCKTEKKLFGPCRYQLRCR